MWLFALRLFGWWQDRKEARNRFYAQVADIALKHWKLILVIALVIYAALSINSLIKQRNQAIEHAKTAQNTLRVYRDMVQHEAELQRAKVAQMREEGKRNVAKIEANHIKDIQHIAKQYGKVIQDDQTNDYRTELANRVREQSETGGSGMPENDKDRLAEGDGNPTAIREDSAEYYRKAYHGALRYIDTITEAGAVCTQDYNTCYAYVVSEQERLGVEE